VNFLFISWQNEKATPSAKFGPGLDADRWGMLGTKKANREVEMDVFEAIKGRRSIRRYQSKDVPEEKVNAVLDAARWAPSWKNTQCSRFIVVRDREIKVKLADTLGGVKGGPNPSADAAKNAPVLIVVCAKMGRSGYDDERKVATDKGDYWYMFDAGLAAQNIMLAAHSLGLASVPAGLFDAPKAGKILGVPGDVRVVMLMPLGYPDEKPEPPPRKKIEEIASQDKYAGN
jgi:nitroreductase